MTENSNSPQILDAQHNCDNCGDRLCPAKASKITCQVPDDRPVQPPRSDKIICTDCPNPPDPDMDCDECIRIFAAKKKIAAAEKVTQNQPPQQPGALAPVEGLLLITKEEFAELANVHTEGISPARIFEITLAVADRSRKDPSREDLIKFARFTQKFYREGQEIMRAKLVNPPVVMPASAKNKFLCRLGFHDYSGGILPGLFEMRFEGLPGSWWPISSSILNGGYCIYCGDCLTDVVLIPSMDNPKEFQISGPLEDILKLTEGVKR